MIAYCTGGITRYVWSGDNLLWEMRGPGADSTFPGELDDISDNRAEFGVVGYTHAGGVDRPLVVWKGMGANTSIVVVPHMNWRGLFGRGTNSSGGATTVAIEWPGFQTTAYHSVAPSQESTTNWMRSLIDGQRDPGGGMYMRNRYYDPATGQFTQTDPIGLAGGLNTYGFAAGDPANYSDPYGLGPCYDAQGNKVPCAEPAGGPPVALPPGRNQPEGKPNRWRAVPGSGRRTKWVPVYPVPTPDGRQPGASWDSEGHWDVDGLPGSNGERKRFDENGNEVDHDGNPLPAPSTEPTESVSGCMPMGGPCFLNLPELLRRVGRIFQDLPPPPPVLPPLPGGVPLPVP